MLSHLIYNLYNISHYWPGVALCVVWTLNTNLKKKLIIDLFGINLNIKQMRLTALKNGFITLALL